MFVRKHIATLAIAVAASAVTLAAYSPDAEAAGVSPKIGEQSLSKGHETFGTETVVTGATRTQSAEIQSSKIGGSSLPMATDAAMGDVQLTFGASEPVESTDFRSSKIGAQSASVAGNAG